MSSNSLLQRIVDANGGLEYWKSVQSLSVSFEFLGPALESKGLPGPYKVEITVETKSQKVVFKRFGDFHGSWSPTRTEVGKIGQDTLDVRENPRAAFNTHNAESQWDIHNLFWFVGYAFWNYFNFPFYLEQNPEIKIRELEPLVRENDEKWPVLEVIFPDGYPTHTKTQYYDFDDQYRLRRMRYSVDVFKNNDLPAWHNCFNHAVAEKINYPTLRVVNISVPGVSFFSPFMLRDIKLEVNQE
ncbi:hypothetical protein GGI42DRAFT_353736 [Trichoderma sp. SZMC 28013]